MPASKKTTPRRASNNEVISDTVTVDSDVPKGLAPVRYHFSGHNTAYNEVARGNDGYPQVQTEVDLIFASGLHEGSTPDGVSCEAVLAAVDHHLSHLLKTPNGSQRHAQASALVRKAIQTLETEGLSPTVSAF